ncbi:MAG: MoaD/ThiS family protein [Microthrixaceae bacterium]
MLVKLRNPTREVTLEGPMQVSVLLARLEVNRESVIVIRGGEIVAGDALIAEDDTVELRPVISGGAA